jgi:micrococcal nuclease
VFGLGSAADFSRQVVGVADGDTLGVLYDGRAERVRLHGIHCPENGQAFGNQAKQFASDMAFNKQVTVKAIDRDESARASIPSRRLKIKVHPAV